MHAVPLDCWNQTMWGRTLYGYGVALQNKNSNILHLLCAGVFCSTKWSRRIQSRDCAGFQYWGFIPDQNFHYLVGSPVAQVRGLRDRWPGLRVGGPPKAITFLPLPQPVSRFHPIAVLRRRVPALQLNPIQHQYLDKWHRRKWILWGSSAQFKP